VIPAYGAFNARMKIANRWSFLIDKEGIVRYAQHAGLNEPTDIEAMKNAADDLFREQQ